MNRILAFLTLTATLGGCATPYEQIAVQEGRKMQADWDKCIDVDLERRFPFVEGEQDLIYLSEKEVSPVFIEMAYVCREKLAMEEFSTKDALINAISHAYDRFKEMRARNYDPGAWI